MIAISLVLIGVFLPTAFITGLQGTFFKQFAITIAASTAISLIVSLTLSPAMAALLLKPRHRDGDKQNPIIRILGAPLRLFFRGFNWAFEGSLACLRLADREVDPHRRRPTPRLRWPPLSHLRSAGVTRRPASSRSSIAPTSSPHSSFRRARLSTARTLSSAMPPTSC